MAYWIILGVASSIGLGTGLHTFVLYLGPWIAKVKSNIKIIIKISIILTFNIIKKNF